MHSRRASDPAQNPPAPPLPLNLAKTAFLLDFDGTLVDIAPTPDAVTVAPGLTETLQRLRAVTGDAVAIISGRTIEEIDQFLPHIVYAISGEHGAAFREAPDAAITHLDLPSPPPEWLRQARQFGAMHEGSIIEPKKNGLVLHYRNCPDAAAVFERFAREITADHTDFYVQPAKMAWEIRSKGVDKGKALRRIMSLPKFRDKLPIFVGDDKTDIDGVHAAQAMGGKGYLIPEDFATSDIFRAWLRHCAEMRP
ncbi:trehalose-phosphatase [Candidatus Kirkpatrickella diaphorinae]|uniref:Trehalose 6-phosphate phosphatase n=1 Tax=Candidatus Kirkpatrickella diaphorinae TaxID=2984322 RepID=A0ABY6GIJ6_9PROT|nr:trehalose-phosphatase [Candidatus Kirkpatrickella diaphorinae]UYH51335.1 trehalose-phosphatase [Candidatus Kirkpatrickella diaphorinae]